MKLHVMSDVHIDYNSDQYDSFVKNLDPTGIDAAIVAGDIMDCGRKTEGKRTEFIKLLCQRYPYVFMVMGNHDYYGSSFKEVDKANEELQYMFYNLIIMEPGKNYVHESGLKLAGGTLWYRDSDEVQLLKGSWPDFRFIRYDKSEIFKRNTNFRDGLKDLQGQWRPDIIISHMAPSELSITNKYKGNRWNCFFVSDETELILKIKPKLWVHGHMHDPFDYKLGDTRVYCNPRGYPYEGANPDFFKRLLVEV